MRTLSFDEIYFSFCFIILNVRTKVPKVLNNRLGSSGLKENVLTFDFIWKIIILYDMIVLLRI